MVKRLFIFLFFIIVFLVCIFYTNVYFINNALLSDSLRKELDLPDNSSILDIKLFKFPVPKIKISNIRVAEDYEVKDLTIFFDSLSLFFFNPKINSIKINELDFFLDESIFDFRNHDLFIKKYLEKFFIKRKVNISNINFFDKIDLILVLKNCFFDTKIFKSDQIFFGAEIPERNINISGVIRSEVSNKTFDLELEIFDENSKFYLVEKYIENKLYSGSGGYIVKNLANVLTNLIPELNLLLRKINQSDLVNINFTLLPKEDLLLLENLSIDSNAFHAKGNISLGRKDSIENVINLYFSQIDLKKLFISSSDFLLKEDNPNNGLRFIFGNKSLLGQLLIKEVVMDSSRILSDINLSINLKNGILEVSNFSGIIDSGGKFAFVGNITQNSVRSIFDGKIFLEHKDLNKILDTIGYNNLMSAYTTPFILTSDLKLTLIDVFLRNLLIKNDSIKIEGGITTRFIGFMPHIQLSLDISSLDIGNVQYPIITPMVSFIEGLFSNMKESSYYNRYIPIRTIGYLLNFDLIFNNLFFKGNELGKVSILGNLSPGNFECTHLDFRDSNLYFDLSAQLLANSMMPQLEIKINDFSLNSDFFILDNFLLFKKNVLDVLDFEKLSLRLEVLSGRISSNKLLLEHLKGSLFNDNNLLKINNINCDLLGGKLEAEGNILLYPLYNLNFVYALNSINLNRLSNFLDENKIYYQEDGAMSINGTFSTRGNTLDSLLYNLNLKSDFIVKNLKFYNFSIDSLIEKLNDTNYNVENLKSDINTSITQGHTLFTQINGGISLREGVIDIRDMLLNTKYSSGIASIITNIYNTNTSMNSIFSFYTNINSSILSRINVNITANGPIFNMDKNFDDKELIFLFNKKK